MLLVSQISGHDEIVLHNKAGFFCVEDESLDAPGAFDSLFRVEVGRGLVDQIYVSGLSESNNGCDSLQLSSY